MHIYVSTFTHTRRHTRTRAHAHTRTRAHAHTRTRAHAHTRTRTHAHTHTRTHAHTRTRAHAHTRTRAHAHTRTHAHTHTCPHAHLVEVVWQNIPPESYYDDFNRITFILCKVFSIVSYRIFSCCCCYCSFVTESSVANSIDTVSTTCDVGLKMHTAHAFVSIICIRTNILEHPMHNNGTYVSNNR